MSTAVANRSSLRAVLCGLQFRWTALLTVFMFVLAVSGDMFIQRHTERLVMKQALAQATQECESIAAVVGPTLRRRNLSNLEEIARHLEVNKSVLYVQFFDHAGQMLLDRSGGRVEAPALAGRTMATAKLTIDRLSRQMPQWYAPPAPAPLFMDVARSVVLAGNDTGSGPGPSVGYVRIGFDLSQPQADLGAFLQQARYVSFLCIVIIIPVAFMIVRRVAAPINDLNHVVSQLAEGDFRVRAGIQRSDEIGQLAGSFNRMADELSLSNNRLVKLNAELEDRVLQRTRQLKDLAARDPLTGLYNRRHLGEVITRRFSESERYGTDLSCMMIDLDNFKKVNDQFGHEMGDNLLIMTGDVIRSQLRGADVGARFGGDEFCVLLPQTSAEQARQVGERIVKSFEENLKKQMPEHGQRFGMSVGVAGVKELNLVHPDELMKAADQALYEAKEAGKNRIHMADTLV